MTETGKCDTMFTLARRHWCAEPAGHDGPHVCQLCGATKPVTA